MISPSALESTKNPKPKPTQSTRLDQHPATPSTPAAKTLLPAVVDPIPLAIPPPPIVSPPIVSRSLFSLSSLCISLPSSLPASLPPFLPLPLSPSLSLSLACALSLQKCTERIVVAHFVKASVKQSTVEMQQLHGTDLEIFIISGSCKTDCSAIPLQHENGTN